MSDHVRPMSPDYSRQKKKVAGVALWHTWSGYLTPQRAKEICHSCEGLPRCMNQERIMAIKNNPTAYSSLKLTTTIFVVTFTSVRVYIDKS